IEFAFTIPSTDMTDIKLVLFDMNDVLCHYDKSARIAHLAKLAGKAPAAIEKAIWGSGFEDEGDAGGLDEGAYLQVFGERIGYPLTVQEWATSLKVAVAPIAGTLALAAAIGKRTRVAVLTNNNLLLRSEIDRIFPDLHSVFGSDFHVSAEFKARKPDREAYRRCLAILNTVPAAALFVDDSAVNIAGAEQVGLIAHRYTDLETLTKQVTELGLLST